MTAKSVPILRLTAKPVHAFLVVGLIVALGSCRPESVEFRRIDNIKILSTDGALVSLRADAVLYNPNSSSGNVRKIDLVVLYKDKEVAKIDQESQVRVKGRREFMMPLKMQLDLSKIEENWLSGLIRVFTQRNIELHFVGEIRVRSVGIAYKIPVDYTEEVRF